MRKIINRRFLCIFMVLLTGLSSLVAETKTVDVMFMHDVHSFLDRIAQAKTLINQQKAANPETLVLDAGDFSQGTLYQTVYARQLSLEFLASLVLKQLLLEIMSLTVWIPGLQECWMRPAQAATRFQKCSCAILTGQKTMITQK